ncbi:hypothetical protein C1645_835212 [Glomus cerebriforme]|uniref:Uncharacterized protein n=1 Tax=Glomus cerebriforme TaxID=658196 RepID=A0A397S9A6_9GLOM|nr:hypothetical protein C1645_835212 [Glomus cerebriforme]
MSLISGYCIISKIGSHFLQLFINENNKNLEFKWVDYDDNDSIFAGDPIAENIDNMFFESLQKYIDNQSDIKDKVSIPNFLELNIYKNAIYFHNAISYSHDKVFLSSKAAYKASTKIDKFAKSLNKYVLELDEKFFKDNDCSNKKVKRIFSFQNEPSDTNYTKAFATTTCIMCKDIKNIALENTKKALYASIENENHKASSKQMEHAVLIRILNTVISILEETDMLLDIVVDGDLDSNRTLCGVKYVNKIFPD